MNFSAPKPLLSRNPPHLSAAGLYSPAAKITVMLECAADQEEAIRAGLIC